MCGNGETRSGLRSAARRRGRCYPLTFGRKGELPQIEVTLVTAGGIVMPMMELWGGSLVAALDWLRRSLEQIASLLRPKTALYDLENSALLWLCVNPAGPSRRFHMSELASELSS